MQVSLPMYGLNRDAVNLFWQSLRARLLADEIEAPAALVWPQDLLPHWRQPDLLLSQTCGYPLVHLLPQVRVLGAFHYAADGCEGPNYRSWIVVRADDNRQSLTAFRGATVAWNSEDSQSGYHALRALIAPLADQGRFFGDSRASGAHVNSMAMVRRGEADIAAIDCVTWALLKQEQPAALEGLRVIAQTDATPGLPLITHSNASDRQCLALQQALAASVAGTAADALLITGFSPLPRKAWEVIGQRALAAGSGRL
ncbi:PhnD/SsuA/transferrin family substrate-binding protein [Paramixta manurensis]|uniref:PhnD/SsuA/transferrin family substrate-binding protein n=1 Tax=Paramixta manurensis TaxID=2740817 RepID=A0A6M8UFB1_9GAMM|nr:PhnD/SsuA/transferrin family substrate-binding protein [Erwiniaceae bacterium PD-1]